MLKLSFFLSRTCPKQNIFKIVIVTMFCRSKNISNLIIPISLHLPPMQISNHCLLINSLCALLVGNVNFLWNLILDMLSLM